MLCFQVIVSPSKHNHEDAKMTNKNKNLDKKLEEIAQRVFEITLEERGSDSLDFHDISVWTLKRLMKEAYELDRK